MLLTRTENTRMYQRIVRLNGILTLCMSVTESYGVNIALQLNGALFELMLKMY